MESPGKNSLRTRAAIIGVAVAFCLGGGETASAQMNTSIEPGATPTTAASQTASGEQGPTMGAVPRHASPQKIGTEIIHLLPPHRDAVAAQQGESLSSKSKEDNGDGAITGALIGMLLAVIILSTTKRS